MLEALLEVKPDGTLIPALAQEVPTLENGGISEDLTTITYKLKPDVIWADGTPFTADDVVFTWQYCVEPDDRLHLGAGLYWRDQCRSRRSADGQDHL